MKGHGGLTMSTQELEENALKLRPIDKIHLIEIMLESLDRTDNEIEKEWIAESEERYDAYKKGEIKEIPLEKIKERYVKYSTVISSNSNFEFF
ncbi:MAG: addiction module protein [bacterium]